MVILSICAPRQIALYTGCSIFNRLAYSFFHVNIFHALLNVWCLLSITFRYNLSWVHFMVAYIIAVCYPTLFLEGQPIVGFSGVCFALLGMLSFRVARRLYFQLVIWVNILLGFIVPGIAGFLHLYCFVVGVVVALVSTPIEQIYEGKGKATD